MNIYSILYKNVKTLQVVYPQYITHTNINLYFISIYLTL